jgi:ribonuclease HII
LSATVAQHTAGVDEAGRGPLAGPVYAAAVILHPALPIAGLRDSKQLSAVQRSDLAGQIRSTALAWHIAWADVEEIDSLNILGATLLAMRRALCGLAIRPEQVLVDGNREPAVADLNAMVHTVVGGDATVPAISAASILAKQARDARMVELDRCYPGYHLARHKGYPTALHVAALASLGPSPQHRLSFAPVRRIMEQLQR